MTSYRYGQVRRGPFTIQLYPEDHADLEFPRVSDLEGFVEQLWHAEWLSARAAVPKPEGMSDKRWAWWVLGLGDCVGPRSAIPSWAWGVEGLDTSLRPPLLNRGARPEPRLIRSPEDSEAVAAEWLRYFGFDDAECTGVGADGGVDVEGTDVVAQVKAEAKPTGRPIVQQIRGIGAHRDVECAAFSLAGYTAEALGWADEAGVALFQFDLQGEPQAENGPARRMADRIALASEPDVGETTDVSATFFGTEAETIALTAMAVHEMEQDVESFDEKWAEERRKFTKLAGLPPHRQVPSDAWYSGGPYQGWYDEWCNLWRTAREVWGMAKLMEQLDLPFVLEPILVQIVWVVNEPELSQMAARWHDGTYGFTDQELESWISRRERYEGDAEIKLTRLPSEDEAFIRRNSTMLDDWTPPEQATPRPGPAT